MLAKLNTFALVGIDAVPVEAEVDTSAGLPRTMIFGLPDCTLLSRAAAGGVNSNFGPLSGDWLELSTPELGRTGQIRGFGSDPVLQGVQRDSADFAGLAGLPLLRLAENGGDATSLWVRKAGGGP
jgi:hypothetical protein